MTEHKIHFSSTLGTIRMFRNDPDRLINEYSRSIELFDERDYCSSLRALRVCIENIAGDIFVNAFPNKDLPDGNSRIHGLRYGTEDDEYDSENENVYRVLGRQLETAYHICCKASHDDPYDITESDAALCLHLFSRSVDIFHNRILHYDPR